MTALLTKLQALLELAEKATPGPWKHVDCGIVTGPRDDVISSGMDRDWQVDEVDAEFIAASRTAVPQLAKALIIAVKGLQNVGTLDGEVTALDTLKDIEKCFEE